MKPGTKTSEFRLAVGVLVLLAAVLILAIHRRDELLAAAAIAGKALISAAYGFSRAFTKIVERYGDEATKGRRALVLSLRRFFPFRQCFSKGSPMNPLFTSAGNLVASKLATPLSLSNTEQAEVSSLVAQGINVAIDLTTKLIAKKYPAVATFITGLIATA